MQRWPSREKYAVAGGSIIEVDTYIHQVPLIMVKNEVVTFAVGLEMVTEQVAKLNTSEAARIFRVSKEDLKRPSGPINLLLGSNNAHIFPFAIRWGDNLRVMKSLFGTCMLLNGSSPLGQRCPEKKTQMAPAHLQGVGTSQKEPGEWSIQDL